MVGRRGKPPTGSSLSGDDNEVRSTMFTSINQALLWFSAFRTSASQPHGAATEQPERIAIVGGVERDIRLQTVPLRSRLQPMAAECRKANLLAHREVVDRQLARELIALRAGRRRSLPV